MNTLPESCETIPAAVMVAAVAIFPIAGLRIAFFGWRAIMNRWEGGDLFAMLLWAIQRTFSSKRTSDGEGPCVPPQMV
jgi:hypothetical protein